IWQGGSSSDLAQCQCGSGIGSARWIHGTEEVGEVFYQVASNAIHERRSMYGHYAEPCNVVEPLHAFEGTSMAATTVNDGAEGMDILAYIASNGYLEAQTCRHANISLTDCATFSPPIQIVRVNGKAKTGLAAVSWPGTVK